MNASKSIRAILWDYDGTLVDSREKNFNVIRKVIEAVIGKEADRIPALRTIESYHSANTQSANWRDLYHRVFGLTPEETDRAGLLWSEYQSKEVFCARELPVGSGGKIVLLLQIPQSCSDSFAFS